MIELLLEAESALSLGLLDRAEILYRQVAGADPRNSIAVVGLARVMLERGDEQDALKHARRALAIDAENTAAQRMVQRLEEVLEYRRSEGLPPAQSRGTTTSIVSAPEAVAPAVPAPSPATPNAEVAESDAAGAPEPASASAAVEPPPPRSIIDRLLRRR